jgi:hypothetical protein
MPVQTLIDTFSMPKQQKEMVSGKWQYLFVFFILFAPIIHFIAQVWSYIPNVPLVDDFDSLLHFGNNFQKLDSTQEEALSFFALHNEHRIVVTRMLSVLITNIFGSVRFDLLIWIGISFLIATVGFVYLSLDLKQSPLKRVLAMTPLLLFTFQTQPLECFVESTVVVPNSGVLLGAVMTFFYLFKKKGSIAIVLAIFSGLLTLVSQGNGVVLLPVGLFLLLLEKRYKAALIWGSVMILGVGVYFLGYVPHPGHPSALEALPHVMRNILYTIYFIGSAPAFGNQTLAAIFGISAYCILAIVMVLGYFRRNKVVTGLLLFLLGSIWINALSRSEFGSVYPLTQNRYGLYSALFCGLLCTALFEMVEHFPKWSTMTVRLGTTLLAGVFCISSYAYTLESWKVHNRRMKHGLHSWAKTGTGLAYPWPDRANAILEESVAAGVYKLPQRVKEAYEKRLRVTEASG